MQSAPILGIGMPVYNGARYIGAGNLYRFARRTAASNSKSVLRFSVIVRFGLRSGAVALIL